MQTTSRPYDSRTDFMRVRDFLIETFALYQRPFNWLIDRWNFCRYFVLPVHTYYNVRYFGVPTRPHHSHRDELMAWERTNRIWESAGGEIVGVVTSENEEPGEAWIQIHPDYTFLYDDMVDYIEAHMSDRVDGLGYVKLYVNEGCELEAVASGRGYRKLVWRTPYLGYALDASDDLVAPQLAEGFVIKSVLEEDDPDKRRIAKSIAFGGGYAPSDWAPASVYEEMQRAPDYRKDLDLFIVAPNGDYASFCTIWIDEKNGYGNFEPVGTQGDYRGQGLARALLTEGFRRMAAYGVTRSFMGSGNEFYRKVGFKETIYAYSPWIKHFQV